jgi:hypothetical protein
MKRRRKYSMAFTPEQRQLLMKLESVFLPSSLRRRTDFYRNPQSGENPSARFVHYTSADAALNIIRTKRIWMRNTTCMTDYREVRHGYDLLNGFLSKEGKEKALMDALERCHSGAATEAFALFRQWWQSVQLNSFITSISEHDPKEDINGRLSMWRAFGGGNIARVAVVLNVPWISDIGDDLKLTFSPVEYLTSDDANSQLDAVVENVKNQCEFLKSIERSKLIGAVFNMVLSRVLCVKHEGFHEEREWRVIYSPKIQSSQFMEAATESVAGVPQTVYRLPLDGIGPNSLQDLSLPKLLDRLIIGPSPYPWAMYDAFATVLTEAGVENAASRIVCSNIPIRA